MNIERILLYILVIYIVIDASRNSFFKSTIKDLLQVVFSGKRLKEINSQEENFQEEEPNLIKNNLINLDYYHLNLKFLFVT